ncbi:hypothetical protein VMT65_31080 [Nocardia sp. CDC153]|uniref:hypothetical protein n=1 Tax=Nocardia sp. CDC153 TaxID=3112167 RepID=UPI002DBECA55|nr:hypothetical protein [Nocardia sp. CDC153]MEC3957513.1 hypothetical protein [Nocardia sp. CDC153]
MRTKRTLAEWVSWAFGAITVGLIPWMVLLARTLPDETRVRNWALAWIGLDLLLALGCAATALLARRRAEQTRIAAAATGSIATLDGWFDLTTAATGAAFLQAALCGVGELLLAAGCGYLALRHQN